MHRGLVGVVISSQLPFFLDNVSLITGRKVEWHPKLSAVLPECITLLSYRAAVPRGGIPPPTSMHADGVFISTKEGAIHFVPIRSAPSRCRDETCKPFFPSHPLRGKRSFCRWVELAARMPVFCSPASVFQGLQRTNSLG